MMGYKFRGTVFIQTISAETAQKITAATETSEGKCSLTP